MRSRYFIAFFLYYRVDNKKAPFDAIHVILLLYYKYCLKHLEVKSFSIDLL